MCDARAVLHFDEARADFCQPCAIYIAGQCHGKVTMARELLADAVGELLAADLTHEHVMATVDGELEGVQRPTGPDVAYPENPRPWVAHLFAPIHDEGRNGHG